MKIRYVKNASFHYVEFSIKGTISHNVRLVNGRMLYFSKLISFFTHVNSVKVLELTEINVLLFRFNLSDTTIVSIWLFITLI